MHWTDTAWLAAGFAAQGLFAARFLVQWVLSERARRSLLPVHFWYLSLIGAVLLLAYAVHRRDPVIAAGQIVGVGIYFRNLHFIFPDRPIARGLRWLWLWLGLCGIAGLVGYHWGPDSASRPLILDDFWTAFGFVGQSVFTARFLVQWWSTERARRTMVPRSFWYLSISGGLMMLSYALAMVDPVIMLGQAMGLVVYTRNLVLMQRGGPVYQKTLSAT